jgi:Zn-dependent M16 (insulinase) family peptidase
MRYRFAAAALAAACSGKSETTSGGSGSGPPPPPADSLEGLVEGGKVHGFTAAAVYLDDDEHRIGARFVHDGTGFTFDYLRIESAPQGFIWVNSFPTSEQGEPHTQEHLLLGKGDRGRKLGSIEAMSLAQSSAFTDQWRTAYHFHTVAGHDAYWPVFENQLDALLYPDYTDEEIRREVRNFGVDKADDGALRLEEKGTVYNEMVRTYEAPDTVIWRLARQLVWGADHPLALESGGYPDAIRSMTAEDIRKFHTSAYHLANMGMVGAFPSKMSLASVLDGTAKVLDTEAGRATGGKRKPMLERDLPGAKPAEPGKIVIADYPYSDTANPGPMMLAWPARRDLDEGERVLRELFLDAFAGDESTTLYKKLIDSKTGANAVGAFASTDMGQPVFLTVSGVKADKLDAKNVEAVRALVLAELERIAKLPDGDPELVAFDARVLARVTDVRRRLTKFLDSPPGFGFRGTSSAWMDHLHQLSKSKGFTKSLTVGPTLAKIRAILSEKQNPWRERLRVWGLLDPPYGLAAKPSPERRQQLDTERKQRIADELARLGKLYATTTPAATLAKYQTDYDAQTKQIEDSAKAVQLPPLVANPPMTLDDDLKYTKIPIAGVSAVVASFDTMASTRVSFAFRLDVVPEADLVYLALLPSLMSDAGIFENGQAIAADAMRDRIRREILDLSVHTAANPRTGRVELVVEGAGNTLDETKLAMTWMQRVMFAPDWRAENLPRLRDIVDQAQTALRQRMLGAEENWVTDPRDAWWVQRQALYAHTQSFLTQAHDIFRLRWMLEDPGDAKVTDEVAKFLAVLGEAKALPRAQLVALAQLVASEKAPVDPKAPVRASPAVVPPALKRYADAAAALSPPARAIAAHAGKDLTNLLSDLPDSSLANDWLYLTGEMVRGLRTGAPAALAKLDAVRKAILAAGAARIYEVGSTANESAIEKDVETIVGRLDPAKLTSQKYEPRRFIAERLRERDPKATEPKFVGLVAPATSSGVHENLVVGPAYTDDADEPVLDYLASNLYAGHGAHSLFMKTWAAGLAYSNGVHPFITLGALEYYAERCPLLPQTMRFVIGELERAKPDTSITSYAIATAFSSRAANSYESRASAMAADLADGQTPEVVKRFRTRILALAKRQDLTATLFKRMEGVYGKVLPGYGQHLEADGVYFVIGPDKQLAAYQDYRRAAVGKDATLYKLYPRDFWITAK